MALIPYKNYEKPRFETALRIEANCLNTSEANKELINKVISMGMADKMWHPIQDYDGCTAAQDTTHPDVICWIHDLLFKARYFKLANDFFIKGMEMQGMKPCKRRARIVLVRIGTVYFKLFNKRVSDYTEEEYSLIIKAIKE